MIYPIGTEKQWVPQKKKRREYFPQTGIFYIKGIGSSHLGPLLENNVDGTRQLLYHPREISLHCDLLQMGIIMKKFDIHVHSSAIVYGLSFFSTLYP